MDGMLNVTCWKADEVCVFVCVCGGRGCLKAKGKERFHWPIKAILLVKGFVGGISV